MGNDAVMNTIEKTREQLIQDVDWLTERIMELESWGRTYTGKQQYSW